MTTIMGEWRKATRRAPRVVIALAQVQATYGVPAPGREALAKRSDDGVGVNPSVFTYR